MPVCSLVKLLPLGTVDDLMHYCIRSSTAPWGYSFDYTTNRHEITVYFLISHWNIAQAIVFDIDGHNTMAWFPASLLKTTRHINMLDDDAHKVDFMQQS